MGYKDFKFITIDYESPFEILKTLKDNSAGRNYYQTLRAVRFAYIANRLTDLTDEMVFHYRALELEKGLTDRVAKKIFRRIVDDTPRFRD